MGLTKQYLRYVPDGVFNIIASPICNVVFVSLHGQEGRYVAVGAGEDVIIWDLRLSEKTVVIPGEKASVTRLASSPNETHVAVGYADGNVKIFDITSTENVCTFSGHKSAITALTFDQDGTRLASGAKDTEVIVWDIVGERGLHRLSGHKGAITQALFMAGHDVLISSAKDSFVKFWDLETAHCFKTLTAHKAEVCDIALVQGDKYLVSGGAELELFVWQIEEQARSDLQKSGAIDESLNDDFGPVKCKKAGSLPRVGYGRLQALVADKSGKVLTCFGADNRLELFWFCSEEEAESKLKKKRKKELKRIKEESGTAALDEKPTELTLLDEVKKLPLMKCSDKLKSCSIIMGKTGELRIATVLRCNKMELFSVEPKNSSPEFKLLRTLDKCGHRSDVRAVCISSDSLAVATGSAEAVKMWNRTSQSCLRSIDTGYVTSLSFVPGDRHLLAGLKSGSILILDIGTAEILEEVAAHQCEVWDICVTPDSRGCISASGDKTLKFWDFDLVAPEDEDGMPIPNKAKVLSLLHTRSLQLEEGVLCLAVSANMRYVAASLLDSTVKIFFLDTLKFFVSLYGHKLPVLSMDISYDSKIICTGSADRNVKIWGLDFGDCHKSIFAHDDSVKGLKFVPKTHYFFTCGKDGLVKQWDADNYERIMTIEGHRGPVHALDVSGGHVVSCGADQIVRIFARTAEPLVLEDEREEERQQEDESALVTGQDTVVPGQAGHSLPSRKTVGAERAAEQLIEAIELSEAYRSDLKDWNGSEETRPVIPPLMRALRFENPDDFTLHALKQIRSSDMEEALLLVPFSAVCYLLNCMPRLMKQGWDVEVLARTLSFVMKVHHEPIVRTKRLLPIIQELKLLSIQTVDLERDRVGTNLYGLKAYQRRLEAEQSVHIFQEATLKRREKEKKRRLKEKAIKRAILKL